MQIKVNIDRSEYPGLSIMDTVLAARGVSREWLVAGEKDLLDGRNLRNFSEGEALLKENIGKRIAIYVDSDTDGFCSSGIMYMWLKEKYGIEAEIIIPEGKVHGILQQLVPQGIDLLIVPDASSSEREIHKELLNRGTKVLVLDHHDVDFSGEQYAVVINPYHPECKYGNQKLCGTGVVYKFIEGVDKNDGTDFHTKHLDLTATATVSDGMDITNMDNKAIVNLGFANFQNEYFLEYKKTNFFVKDKAVDGTIIVMNLVPPINALIRIGSLQDKKELFAAIVGEKAPQLVVPIVKALKAKQDTSKEGFLVRMGMNLNKSENDLKHSVIMVESPPNSPRAMSGVLAAKLTDIYKRPVLIYRIDNGMMVGSGRNVNNSPIANFKDFCNNSGSFNWAEGHQSAFGFSIPVDNKEDFLDFADDNLPDYEPVFHVDFDLSHEEDRATAIREITSLSSHYGPGFQPIVVFDELYVRPSEVNILGAKQNTLMLRKNGIEYIQFNFKDYLPMDITIWSVIGKPSLNEYMGKSSPQIILEGWAAVSVDL